MARDALHLDRLVAAGAYSVRRQRRHSTGLTVLVVMAAIAAASVVGVVAFGIAQ